MNKHLLLLLTVIISLNSYSQISFEKGYYINNSDQKIECLIRNMDWKNNPTEFECKLAENTEQKVLHIKSVKEFGIYNVSKYIRLHVKMDKSSENVNNLSNDRNPIFEEEELFLKVLVEGKANLYKYENESLRRYFYNKENSDVEQLVFKSYKTSNSKIAQNNNFRHQLGADLKCQNITIRDIENVDYKKNELVNFFVKYNQCSDSEFINYEEKQKRDLLNLTLRPGLNSSSLTIQNGFSDLRDVDFGNEFGFRLGVEAEFILAYNKSKWAILLEPTFQYFKSEKELSRGNVKVDYTSVELPIGLRHYFFLNNNSKFFMNASYILDFTNNSKITSNILPDLEISKSTNLGFGIGYKNYDKYSLELRYLTSRDILNSYMSWDSDYSTLSIIFGYSIF